MKKDKLLMRGITIIVMMLLFGGCSMSGENFADATAILPNTQPVLVESTNAPTRNVSITPSHVLTPNQLASPTITSTVEATPTSVPMKSETTPTIELIETPLSNSQSRLICSGPPARFDIQSVLDVYNFSYLYFLDEETLLFRGWAPRPVPKTSVETTAPSPSATQDPSTLGGFVSARVLLKGGQINLTTGDIISSTLDFTPLLNNPCNANCPIEVIGESPDQQWQLVQISDASESQIGFWILTKNQAIRLVDYVPSASIWQWAEDSSLLWLVHTTGEHGADSLVIELDEPLITTRSEAGSDNPLDATYYFLAFSPQDKTVVSTDDPFERGLPDKDEVYIFDLAQSLLHPVETQTISGITNVVWNEATQNYLLSIVQEDGTEIRTLDGEVFVRIPEYQMPRLKFALSPSGTYLAIGYGAVDGILVFTCK